MGRQDDLDALTAKVAGGTAIITAHETQADELQTELEQERTELQQLQTQSKTTLKFLARERAEKRKVRPSSCVDTHRLLRCRPVHAACCPWVH